MKNIEIGGLQKTTTIDYPEKLASTIFTQGCNLRCPYCHNSKLVLDRQKENLIPEEEVIAFLKKRKNILQGVCISGGEPLKQKKLLDFISKVKELGYLVKLDTNGFYPIKLEKLIEDGLLDYIAMDIKSSADKYALATGVDKVDIKKVNQSIKLLQRNQVTYEFRTTAVKGIHTLEDFEKIALWIEASPRYYIQNFVDSADILSFRREPKTSLEPFSKEELEEILQVVKKRLPQAQIR